MKIKCSSNGEFYNEKIIKPRLSEITNLFILEPNLQIQTGLLDLNYAPKKRTIQIGVLNDIGVSINKTTCLANINFSPSYAGYSMNYENLSGYIIQESVETETKNEIFGQVLFGKYYRNYSINSNLTLLSKRTKFNESQSNSSFYVSISASGSYKISNRIDKAQNRGNYQYIGVKLLHILRLLRRLIQKICNKYVNIMRILQYTGIF